MPVVDLAVVGAGIAGCGLVAGLRHRGWQGSIALLESGRGPGGRAATRRPRHDPGLQVNHGAPLFNVQMATPLPLLQALADAGLIGPFSGPVCSLDQHGQIGPPIDDGFTTGALWQGVGGMDRIAAGLLELAGLQPGSTALRCGTLVRHLRPGNHGGAVAWTLLGASGTVLVQCRWLVLSGTLLAHARGQAVFGWDAVPLQQAAAALGEPQLQRVADGLAALDSAASSNLLLSLHPEQVPLWQQQPWRLLQLTPAAQKRWGLRRVSLQQPGPQPGPQPGQQPGQQPGTGRWAVVAESSPAFAQRHQHVYGSRSAAAQLLGVHPAPADEAAVINALQAALDGALGLPTAGAQGQLMRWGAAFPQAPGLPEVLQLCPQSRIGFCGDFVASGALGRVEGALRSADRLAQQLLTLL